MHFLGLLSVIFVVLVASSELSAQVDATPTPASKPAALGAPMSLVPTAASTPGGASSLAGAEGCSKTLHGGTVSGSTPASTALFKRKVSDNHTMVADDGHWYGVTFEAFTVGNPIRNGSGRSVEGAPMNAILYPVASTHVVCEGAAPASERRRIQGQYLCFVSAENEWRCGPEGMTATTRLK
jgi:hypothetical protein